MTTTGKVITTIIIIILIVLGVWWYMSSQNTASNAPMQMATSTEDTSNTNGTDTSGVSATDTSNAALDQDMTNVNAQMNGLSSDNTSADQSMNDQPVSQQ